MKQLENRKMIKLLRKTMATTVIKNPKDTLDSFIKGMLVDPESRTSQ